VFLPAQTPKTHALLLRVIVHQRHAVIVALVILHSVEIQERMDTHKAENRQQTALNHKPYSCERKISTEKEGCGQLK
jgi:hypothetical protein